MRWPATFPFDAELPSLDGAGEGAGETALHGSTTLPEQDPFTTFLGLAHWCQALTDLRRALPGTTWDVSVDDEPVPQHAVIPDGNHLTGVHLDIIRREPHVACRDQSRYLWDRCRRGPVSGRTLRCFEVHG